MVPKHCFDHQRGIRLDRLQVAYPAQAERLERDGVAMNSRNSARIMQGDCLDRLRDLPDNHVHTCVTSPPYFGLRDYGVDGQIGLEATPDEFVAKMAQVFREVRRVLRDDGTLWLNLGDSYAGGNTGGKWREGP